MLMLLTGLIRAAETEPGALVKSVTSDVLDVIRQNKDRKALYALAEQKVLPHFDFDAMTQLAVGRQWREASPEQQKALLNAFRSLLVATYTTALNQNVDAEIRMDIKPVHMKPGDTEVTVRSVAVQSGRQPVAIDYRMQKKDSGWKVYDVIIENLSLITTYRASFASEMNRSGIDGLIKALESRNRDVAAK